MSTTTAGTTTTAPGTIAEPDRTPRPRQRPRPLARPPNHRAKRRLTPPASTSNASSHLNPTPPPPPALFDCTLWTDMQRAACAEVNPFHGQRLPRTHTDLSAAYAVELLRSCGADACQLRLRALRVHRRRHRLRRCLSLSSAFLHPSRDASCTPYYRRSNGCRYRDHCRHPPPPPPPKLPSAHLDERTAPADGGATLAVAVRAGNTRLRARCYATELFPRFAPLFPAWDHRVAERQASGVSPLSWAPAPRHAATPGFADLLSAKRVTRLRHGIPPDKPNLVTRSTYQ